MTATSAPPSRMILALRGMIASTYRWTSDVSRMQSTARLDETQQVSLAFILPIRVITPISFIQCFLACVMFGTHWLLRYFCLIGEITPVFTILGAAPVSITAFTAYILPNVHPKMIDNS